MQKKKHFLEDHERNNIQKVLQIFESYFFRDLRENAFFSAFDTKNSLEIAVFHVKILGLLNEIALKKKLKIPAKWTYFLAKVLYTYFPL